MRLRNILANTLTAVLLPAADTWTANKPGQWSEREIRGMVTDSPWAREANVTLKGDTDTAMDPGSGRFGGGVSDDRGEGGAAGRIGGRATASGHALPNIIVRWDSAAPVCQACAKGGLERYLFSCYSKLMYLSGLAGKFDELSKDFYILSMSNYPNLGRSRDGPQHSAAANAALERMGERLQQATWIRRKGKPLFRPAKVLVMPAGEALLPIVFFPRTEAITLDDREVSFESDGGMVQVKSKFNLRKMVFNGKLEL